MKALPTKLMSKLKHCDLFAGLLIVLLAGFVGQVNADPDSRQVSYSPDHWPSRWSSAIRQQQTARFPTREEVQTPPAELPEAVFEQDLFYSPSTAGRYEGRDRRYSYGKRAAAPRFSRHSGRHIRDAAFAYQNRFGVAANNYAGSVHMKPLGPSVPMMDPMPVYPGIGFPVMPGLPGAYPANVLPFGGMPLGYPGNMAMWNPATAGW